MYNFLVKNGQRVAFGLGLLITIIFLVSIFAGMEEYTMMPEEERVTTDIFNFGLKGALILAAAAALGIILFGLYHILTNFRSSIKGLLGVAALIVIFIIGYNVASPEPETAAIAEAVQKTGGISDSQMKLIGGAIITALVLVGVAAASFVLSEIRNFFK